MNYFFAVKMRNFTVRFREPSRMPLFNSEPGGWTLLLKVFLLGMAVIDPMLKVRVSRAGHRCGFPNRCSYLPPVYSSPARCWDLARPWTGTFSLLQ